LWKRVPLLLGRAESEMHMVMSLFRIGTPPLNGQARNEPLLPLVSSNVGGLNRSMHHSLAG
jgi:hypothetical protein